MKNRIAFAGPGVLRGLAVVGFAAVGGCAAGGSGSSEAGLAPRGVYEAWVASESVDQISRIRFDGATAEVVDRRPVGSIPVEIEGPHGIAVSPDGAFVYVSLAHGLPNGSLLKIDARTGRLAGRAPLGLFPATVALTPDGRYGFVSNFNLHGDPVPSSISMVDLATMTEVARTVTCTMPHGSRVNPQGTRHYSVCMMEEVLIEIDATTGSISRSFTVGRGMEGPGDDAHAGAAGAAAAGAEVCSPTWAEPSAQGDRVFVTCNRAREVLEVDVDGWSVVRRFSTGDNPYNIGVSPDGRLLLVTLRNRTDPALEIFDLRTGTMAGRVPVSTTLAHGVAVTPDSRYAFVTVEGVGSEPGKVDIVDLERMSRVASVDVGQQATGVAVVSAAAPSR